MQSLQAHLLYLQIETKAQTKKFKLHKTHIHKLFGFRNGSTTQASTAQVTYYQMVLVVYSSMIALKQSSSKTVIVSFTTKESKFLQRRNRMLPQNIAFKTILRRLPRKLLFLNISNSISVRQRCKSVLNQRVQNK